MIYRYLLYIRYDFSVPVSEYLFNFYRSAYIKTLGTTDVIYHL